MFMWSFGALNIFDVWRVLLRVGMEAGMLGSAITFTPFLMMRSMPEIKQKPKAAETTLPRM